MEDLPKHSPVAKTKSSRVGTSRKQAANQTLSCAECRRLKLRCDRVFPCGSCQKRGIAELCPEGSLPTRSKAVTSSTDKEQLYRQISELRGRVLELETALESAHAATSSEPHPMLADAQFPRKTSNKQKNPYDTSLEANQFDDNEVSDALDNALGSLNVGEAGRTRFFGRSACVERLFRYHNNGAVATPEEPNILVSAEVAMVYQSFPMLTIGEATVLVQERIWRHLPPLHRAETLRQSYSRHVYHITDIIPENNGWFDDMFSRVYVNARSIDVPLVPFSDSGIRMDEVALLFAYFAMGALTDLDLRPFNFEAEAYACLSRAALTSTNLLKHPTIIAVETLVLLGYFEAMWGETIGSGDGWIITALATKLAQLIGVHRSSRQFGLEEIESERRSRVYWELYTLELLEGLSHGRPSTFSLIPSDVGLPSCGNPKTNLHIFRYRLAAECFSPLSKQVFGIKMPAYPTIIELDRKVRAVCADFGVGLPGQSMHLVGLSEADAMRNYTKRVLRESTLLYLHRAFFVKALAANPLDPQHTKYGLSVSGAYESAMALVQALGEIQQDHPAASSRALLCWNHSLCSVFILGSITTCCPGSRLAPLAAKRLHDAELLYGRASEYGGRAAADKPLVTRMAEKSVGAPTTYANERRKTIQQVPNSGSNPNQDDMKRKHDLDDNDDDELAVLGGLTRIIHSSQHIISSNARSPEYESPPVFPSQHNVSPHFTSGSLPISGPTTGGHCRRDDAYLASMAIHGLIQHQGQGSSPLSGITDHPTTPGGSVGSELLPEEGAQSGYATVHQDSLMHMDPHTDTPIKLLDAIQTRSQSHGGTGFNYINEPLDYETSIAGHDDVARTAEDLGIRDHLVQQNEHSPIEVSIDPQEWSFLDNWYGHVFSLDVFPPGYGR